MNHYHTVYAICSFNAKSHRILAPFASRNYLDHLCQAELINYSNPAVFNLFQRYHQYNSAAATRARAAPPTIHFQ